MLRLDSRGLPIGASAFIDTEEIPVLSLVEYEVHGLATTREYGPSGAPVLLETFTYDERQRPTSHLAVRASTAGTSPGERVLGSSRMASPSCEDSRLRRLLRSPGYVTEVANELLRTRTDRRTLRWVPISRGPATSCRAASGVGAWFERGAGRGGVQGSFVPGQERRSA